jgi:hypothetical protein
MATSERNNTISVIRWSKLRLGIVRILRLGGASVLAPLQARYFNSTMYGCHCLRHHLRRVVQPGPMRRNQSTWGTQVSFSAPNQSCQPYLLVVAGISAYLALG